MPSRASSAKAVFSLLGLFTSAALLSRTEFNALAYAESQAPARAGSAPMTETKLINELLESAFDAYVDEDYARSIANFEKVLSMNPADKAAQKGLKQSQRMQKRKMDLSSRDKEEKLSLARRLIKNEKWLDAMDDLSSIQKQDPNDPDVQEIQTRLAATFRAKMADTKAAPANDLVFQGMLYYLQKKYPDAIVIWKEAVKIRPEDFKVVIYIERTEQVLEQNEKYETMVLGRQRAKAFFIAGRYGEAARLWKKILDLDPEDKEAQEGLAKANSEFYAKNKQSLIGEHYDKGHELFDKGQYGESLKEWKLILEIDPANEVAKNYVERIRTKGVTKEMETLKISSATTVPRVIASSGPTIPRILLSTAVAPSDENYETGITLFRQARYPEALEYFEKALRLRPEDAKASEWLEKIRAEQKEKAQKHYTQGSVRYAEGKVDEAMEEWREALKIDPRHTPTLKALNKLSSGEKPKLQ